MAGRRVVVTGAGSGIGQSVALRLFREGARLAVLDVRGEAADAVSRQIQTDGGHAVAIGCDVSDWGSVAEAMDLASEELGGLDTMVVCAGISFPAHTHLMTSQEWDAMLGVNLTGAFHAVRHALPHLLRNEASAIVTIGSVASLVAASNNAAYEASKGGLAQFTRAVAVEYVDRGLRANCICPGRIKTDLAVHSRSLVETSTADRSLIAERVRVPIPGRADAEVIAAAAAYLCSEEASFVTGALLPVDGGYSAI